MSLSETRRKYFKTYYATNKQRLLKYKSEWSKRNRAKQRKYAKKHRDANPGYYREKGWKVQGIEITWAQYTQLYTQCRGCCMICGDHHESLEVDHDHATGAVRGLLCSQCNLLLGCFETFLPIFGKAFKYLYTQGSTT